MMGRGAGGGTRTHARLASTSSAQASHTPGETCEYPLVGSRRGKGPLPSSAPAAARSAIVVVSRVVAATRETRARAASRPLRGGVGACRCEGARHDPNLEAHTIVRIASFVEPRGLSRVAVPSEAAAHRDAATERGARGIGTDALGATRVIAL